MSERLRRIFTARSQALQGGPLVAELASLLELTDLQRDLGTALDESSLPVRILVDRTDEGFEHDAVGIGLVAGLARATIEFSRRSNDVRAILFLRDNIFRCLRRDDPDFSKDLEGQDVRLHWDEHALLSLVALRLRASRGWAGNDRDVLESVCGTSAATHGRFQAMSSNDLVSPPGPDHALK